MDEEKRTIKLRARLRAYTRGVIPVIPDYSQFVTKEELEESKFPDAPSDDKVYGRKNGEWAEIEANLANKVIVEEGSGLSKENLDEEGYLIKLSVKKWEGKEQDLPYILEKDTTYYAYDNRIPDYILSNGTAYSDENNEYDVCLNFGNASTKIWDIKFNAMNAKGEYV